MQRKVIVSTEKQSTFDYVIFRFTISQFKNEHKVQLPLTYSRENTHAEHFYFYPDIYIRHISIGLAHLLVTEVNQHFIGAGSGNLPAQLKSALLTTA